MKKEIDSNTIMLVGSAPEFSFGQIDPLGKIGELAKKYKIGFHVDCCLGSFVVPFLPKLAEKANFTNPNITSISCDHHKYGLAPKGVSTVKK